MTDRVDNLELSLRDLVAAIRQSHARESRQAALNVGERVATLEQQLAEHAALRSMVHGVGPGYVVAKTANPQGFVRWVEIVDRPSWLDQHIDLSTITIDASQITGTISIDRLPVHPDGPLVTHDDPRLNARTLLVPVGEPLSAGDFVAITHRNNVAMVVRAHAADPMRAAVGFVTESYGLNQQALIYPVGINPMASTTTPVSVQDVGRTVFLSTQPGIVSITPPNLPGQLLQPVGSIIEVSNAVVSVLVRYEYRFRL